MTALALPLINGSKEDGLSSLSHYPSSFFDWFCVTHGVPFPYSIAAGTAGPRVGGLTCLVTVFSWYFNISIDTLHSS
jgi:hypothetical protein